MELGAGVIHSGCGRDLGGEFDGNETGEETRGQALQFQQISFQISPVGFKEEAGKITNPAELSLHWAEVGEGEVDFVHLASQSQGTQGRGGGQGGGIAELRLLDLYRGEQMGDRTGSQQVIVAEPVVFKVV
jgi:hypothetical protein